MCLSVLARNPVEAQAVKVGDTSMEEMRGASFAGSSRPLLGRERTAVDVEGEGWVLLKIP